MTRLPQSREDLINHLKQQIGFLQKSCALFDAGDFVEAKRLGVTLRLLLHDTRNSKSLLSQLNMLNKRFYDTADDWNPSNMLAHHGLVGILFSNDTTGFQGHFHHKKVSNSRFIPFDKWWEKVVIVDGKKNKFSRKQLILSITDMDGGAHVDPEIEESYHELTRFNTVGWKFYRNGQEYDLNGVELHSIRQIAQEVLDSLRQSYPKLFQ